MSLAVPSTYSVRLVNIEVPAGPMDDGRHAHPHPHRPPPRGPDPARPGARESRAAPSAGRPPTDRDASTPAPLRPSVLGPARPSVARLGGGRRHRPTRDRHPVAANRLQAVLDLEEPPARARPPRRRPGRPRADPHHGSRQPPVGRTPDPRRAPEARPRDLAGHGLQVPGPPSNAPIADVAHVPRQPYWEPRLRGLLHRAHGTVQGVVRLRRPGARPPTRPPHQRDRLTHGAVDGPAARGGVPLGHRPALPPAGPRCHLRGRVLQPRPIPGDPGR